MYEAPPPSKAERHNLARRGLIWGYLFTWVSIVIWMLCVDLYFLLVEGKGLFQTVFTDGLSFSASIGLIAALPGAINGALLGTLIYRANHGWWECLGISVLISAVGSFPCVTGSNIITADPPPGYRPPYGLIMGIAFICYMFAMLVTSSYLYKKRQKLPPYIPPRLPLSKTPYFSEPPLLKSSFDEPRPPKSSLPKIEKKLGPPIPPPKQKE